MGRYIPHELREANLKEFLTLNPDSRSVYEYSLKFAQLSLGALEIVFYIRSKISLFIDGLSRLLIKEDLATKFIGDVDMARLIIHL